MPSDGGAGGRGVVVTRDEAADGPLARLLEAEGFRVIRWPTIRTVPPSDPAPLEDALEKLDDFDWVVFTSRRAVASVVERRGPPLGPGGPDPEGVRVAAVGGATGQALRDAGWPVDLVPAVQTGAGLLARLREAGVGTGSRVLFPASAIARDELPDGLIEAGAIVVQVEAYGTESAALDREACREVLESGRAEFVTFTSPSTVTGLETGLGPELMGLARERLRAAAIGPTTGEAAGSAGFEVDVAEEHSLEGLTERLVAIAGR